MSVDILVIWLWDRLIFFRFVIRYIGFGIINKKDEGIIWFLVCCNWMREVCKFNNCKCNSYVKNIVYVEFIWIYLYLK